MPASLRLVTVEMLTSATPIDQEGPCLVAVAAYCRMTAGSRSSQNATLPHA